MSWREHHRRSEEIASEADIAMRSGNVRHAQELYQRAAAEERLAITAIAPSKKRTFSVSAVAIASLYFQGQLLDEAERAACEFFASDRISAWGQQELRTLLVSIHALKETDPIYAEEHPGMLSVSLRGGDIERGGAPASLISGKLKTLIDMLYRTVEHLDRRPYRGKSTVPADLRSRYQPWMTQLAPGSFRFGVGLHSPIQTSFFADNARPAQEISEELLLIVHGAANSSAQPIDELIPDPDYRLKFLRLSRDLAPTERAQFERLALRDPAGYQPATLSRESRKEINRAIRVNIKEAASDGSESVPIIGTLRGLDLEHDWIKIVHQGKLVTIRQAGEAIDDIIGSMVNNEVRVEAVKSQSGVYHFRDIELIDY